MRLLREPKNMSLHVSTTAPCSSAARSIGPPSARSLAHAGTASPWTRSRATPPSG